MTETRLYHPEKWEPLERWLPASICRRQFVWMWHEREMECYRCRRSGELLLLDEHGQCFEMTEVGPMPADFKQHYRRCTGCDYEYHTVSILEGVSDEDDEDDLDDEDDDDENSDEQPVQGPPGHRSLMALFADWSEEAALDPQQCHRFLSELRAFNTLFRSELEATCNRLRRLTGQWLSS